MKSSRDPVLLALLALSVSITLTVKKSELNKLEQVTKLWIVLERVVTTGTKLITAGSHY